MSGQLTTHVLDTAQGRPAANVAVEIWRLNTQGEGRTLLKSTRTNQDGRIDGALLGDEELVEGVYELVFAVGEYFAAQEFALGSPPFLDRVPVRFGIADANAHYHVPLLVSPWSYSTYRGS